MERCYGVGAGDVLGAIQDTPPSTWPATWARSTAGRVKWARVPNQSRPHRWTSGGVEPCRCSRPARDAAPTIAPTIFCSDRLAADAGPGRRRSQLPKIRPDALEAPDFVGIGEKPARQDGQRGRRSGGQCPWAPCQLARPRPSHAPNVVLIVGTAPTTPPPPPEFVAEFDSYQKRQPSRTRLKTGPQELR